MKAHKWTESVFPMQLLSSFISYCLSVWETPVLCAVSSVYYLEGVRTKHLANLAKIVRLWMILRCKAMHLQTYLDCVLIIYE